MSELAYNANGEKFAPPEEAKKWRTRVVKPRGAPGQLFDRNGAPLTIPIDADIEELRLAVGGEPGKYRLDAIDDDGKCIENVPPAYVRVFAPEGDDAKALVPSQMEDTIRQAMQLNTQLAKSVIDKFPDVMTAAAELLRAADGAGLPSRKPRFVRDDGHEVPPDRNSDRNPDRNPGTIAPAPQGFDLNALVAQLVPLLIAALMGKKPPTLAAVFDWRKAAEPKSEPLRAITTQSDDPKVTESPVSSGLPPLDPAALAHIIAIQSALTPQEVAHVQEVGKGLSGDELRAWFDELGKLSVPDAVTRIRALIAGQGGAS